jgi:thioesterase domain-containing protein/acyl carrier protein
VRSRRALDRPYVAPRNELERTLAEIWSRVLGIERVSIHDSFFELGGHSLSALRLSAEASERLDRPFPLPALFESPTIAGAAARLSRPAASLAASCLVPLRPTGSKPALFFVHGGGGLVMSYVPLMRELDTDQPFLGIQAPEPQGSDGAFGSIEELAALYVEAMRSHQPHGPYRVGGHSFGGVVAFQMAAQLVAEGQQVDLVAVVDMAPPTLLDRRGMEALLARGSQVGDGNLQAQVRALLDYRPPKLGGRVTLFRAREEHSLYAPEAKADPSLGWNEFTEQPAEVHVVPGDHFSVLSEPAVRVLAREVQRCLDQSAR